MTDKQPNNDFEKGLRLIWKSFWQPKLFSYKDFKKRILKIIEKDYITKKEYNKLKGYKLVYGCDCKRCRKVQKRIREEEKQKVIDAWNKYRASDEKSSDKRDFEKELFGREDAKTTFADHKGIAEDRVNPSPANENLFGDSSQDSSPSFQDTRCISDSLPNVKAIRQKGETPSDNLEKVK